MAAPITQAIFYAQVRASGLLGPIISDVVFAHRKGMLDAWEQRVWLSDHAIGEVGRGAGKAYGVPVSTIGQTYYGRGACQLTWIDK